MAKIGIVKTVSDAVFPDYVKAVQAAGGEGVALEVTSSQETIAGQVSSCDGFILVGGLDINPLRYGGDANAENLKCLDADKEEYYAAIATEILARTAKPVLGICLGCQMINILKGGTLFEDLPTQFYGSFWHARPKHDKTIETMHLVTFSPDGPLPRIFGRGWLCVNSSHHQAIQKVGDGLAVAAQSPDGVIEGIYSTAGDGRFLVGLQWHPERLFDKVDGHLRVFQALVQACNQR